MSRCLDAFYCAFRGTAFLLATHLALGSSAIAGTFAEVTSFGSNPGNLKMFTYVPDGLPDPAPLVVVLHGCRQSASSYLEHSGWKEQADKGGFALLLPEQQIGPGPIFLPSGRNHLTQCFNFAEVRNSTRDSGEALSIRQMIAQASATIEIDPARIFVNGLSAGGGMTAVMLATYPDVFAAGAIIAGLPYRCGTRTATAEADCGVTLPFQSHKPAPNRTAQDWGDRVRAAFPGFAGPWPRVSIWQGDADGTVDPPNARELVEQWTDVHGIDAIADEEEDLGPVVRQRFAEAEGSVEVESYTLAGFGHATPIDPDAAEEACGQDGEPFILDADICSTHAIARFFGLAGAVPTVTIDTAEMDSGAIVVSGTAEDPDGTPPAVTVRLDGPFTSHEQPATGGASWSARFEGLTDDTSYRPVATAVDADGLVAVATGPLVELGNSPANQPPAIEIATSVVAGDCVRVEGQATDPDGRVDVVAVALGDRPVQPARLVGADFAAEQCGLPNGSYAVLATAVDKLGAEGTASGPSVVVAATRSTSGTWLEHMSAGRLRIYAAPCRSIGFGTCDAAFPAIHAEHGFETFELFAAAAGDDWYVNPGNIP